MPDPRARERQLAHARTPRDGAASKGEHVAKRLFVRLGVSLAVSLALVCAGALLISGEVLPPSALGVWPVGAGGLGALVFGCSGVRLTGGRPPVAGLLLGALFFIALYLFGAVLLWRLHPGSGAGALLLATLAGGSGGGLLAAPKQRRRR
ncbi:MAG: YrzE family protein [Oscillospiraceae bacterium]|jgi:hypothetical protein|nr:YrzE family protein [Oscillospiraceae bacterium]